MLRGHGITGTVVETVVDELRGSASERDRAALTALGIDLDRVRAVVETAFGPDALEAQEPPRRWRLRRWIRRRGPCFLDGAPAPRTGHVPFTPSARKSLELALREALRLNQKFVAAEHIALGVRREGSGLACLVLARRGVPPAALRASIEASVRRSA